MMTEIKIDKIIRAKRKTISIIITPEAKLTIRAPRYTPVKYIHRLVYEKRFWIKEKQDFMRKRPLPAVKEFVNGEDFLFLGKRYKLQLIHDKTSGIELKDNLLLPERFLPRAREKLTVWYKEEGLKKITERVEWYSRLTGLKYRSVRITGAKKRFGSCGAKGTLNFTWRLVMAPVEIIDYVVVHELVHLEVRKHSKKFWNKVKAIMKDYKERDFWLKENGHSLSI